MSDNDHRTSRSLTVKVRDGLDLHVTHWPAPSAAAKPILCLPGLTRNGRDFNDIAAALSSGAGARDVYTLDARGRGLSDHDPDWRNYSLPVEAQDVIDVMTALGLHGASIIGTSRGGLVTMVLGAIQPAAVGAVVLNDIGPVIERTGLMRIAGYVGRMPVPVSWADAEKTVADISRKAFPAVPAEAWKKVARAWFNEKGDRPAPGYDPQLGKSFSTTDATPPSLWPQFETLKHAAMLVIRGETSDLLSDATVAQMQLRHPNCARLTVKGEGHAPLLMDASTIETIRSFFTAADNGTSLAGKVY